LALTPTGAFHIDLLHLNRPALVVARRRRRRGERLREGFGRLQPHVARLWRELAEVQGDETDLLQPVVHYLREFLRLWEAPED
jgi:hypothetical protein